MVVTIRYELLKQKQKQLGITLSHIARETGLSVSHVSYVVNGHRNPSIKSLAMIAHILGVDLNDLAIVDTEVIYPTPKDGASRVV